MILYPAIDLKNGEAVRLEQGDMARATVFNRDPAAQARAFEALGFEWLHLVDLDGAFAGKPVNALAVAAILRAVKIPAQLGGGIRNLATVEAWLREGIARVIVGTAAVRDPEFVKAAAKKYPGKIAVGIDARGGKVAVSGWTELTELGVVELAKRFEDAGVALLIHTDVERDGMESGLNLNATLALAKTVNIPVVASGGFASLDDVRAVTAPRARRLEGAIVGRALYDGRLDARKALALCKFVSAEDTRKILRTMGWRLASQPKGKFQSWITPDGTMVTLPGGPDPLPIDLLVDLFEQLRKHSERKRGEES